MLDSLGRCTDSSAISKGDLLALLTLYAFLFINLTHSLLVWRLDPLKVKQYSAKIPFFHLSVIWKTQVLRNKLRDYWSCSCYSWPWMQHETEATFLMVGHCCCFYQYRFQVHTWYGLTAYKNPFPGNLLLILTHNTIIVWALLLAVLSIEVLTALTLLVSLCVLTSLPASQHPNACFSVK